MAVQLATAGSVGLTSRQKKEAGKEGASLHRSSQDLAIFESMG